MPAFDGCRIGRKLNNGVSGATGAFGVLVFAAAHKEPSPIFPEGCGVSGDVELVLLRVRDIYASDPETFRHIDLHRTCEARACRLTNEANRRLDARAKRRPRGIR